jgi:hypothetical protein
MPWKRFVHDVQVISIVIGIARIFGLHWSALLQAFGVRITVLRALALPHTVKGCAEGG